MNIIFIIIFSNFYFFLNFVCSSVKFRSIIIQWGVPKIHVLTVLTSHHGLSTLIEAHPDVSFTVGQVDDVLTKDGVVLPGLGDAGTRLYGTTPIADIDHEDEELLHPSKRKRSGSMCSM